MDYDVRKDGMINGGISGIMVGYYEPFGRRGYLILWYALCVERKDTRTLLPLYGATRYICDALNLSPLFNDKAGLGEEVKGQQQQNRP